jgi:hypothetical protein
MSTRATYRFEKRLRAHGPSHPALTLYIHHDGYPSGAAAYFWAAHHFETRGCFAEAFIRANDRAELTDSHQVHGDTEYRYSLTDGVLKAEKGFYDSTDTKQWRTIFEGPYWQFINANPESIEGFTPIREIPSTWGPPSLLSRQQVEANVTRARNELDSYRARFPEPSGNLNGCERQVERAQQIRAEYDAAQAFEGHAVASEVQQ